MTHIQRLLPSAIIAAVGVWVAYISYTQEPADAFLFPRLIAAGFVMLAVWDLACNLLGASVPAPGMDATAALNLSPGMLVLLIYIFWGAKALGFYTATTIAVLTIQLLYDPAPRHSFRAWGRRCLITATFVAVMYGLFAKLLGVYTPKEFFH